MRETLNNLVTTGCIAKLSRTLKNGWHSNIFLCPKCNGSFHMILNLKPLNQFIQYKKFKMPNIYTVMAMVKPHDKLISVDLSNAYSSLKIREAIKNICNLLLKEHIICIWFSLMGLQSDQEYLWRLPRP